MDKKIANSCKKYDVVHSKKLGRYLVAAKNLSPGELILREDALVVGPGIFETGIFCFACMRPLPGYHILKTRYSCSKCGVAPLCNRLCESSIGLHAARECNIFREKKDLYVENIEELMRILLHLRLWLIKDDNSEAWNRVENMEAHLKERRNKPVWQERENTIVNVFKKFGLHSTTSEGGEDETVQRLCGVLDVNTFEIRSPGVDNLGNIPQLRGLFLEASLMAHACRPNVHVVVDERFHMSIYAAVPVSAGQPVTFNYVSCLLGTIDRQEGLQEGKYFRCDCNVCKDPLEGGSYLSCLLCPRCRKGYVAIQKANDVEPYGRKTKWQCQKCKRIFRGCLIKSTIDISNNLIDQLDSGSLKAMENLLEKLCRTFHKNHYIILDLKQKLLNNYRDEITKVNPQKKNLQKIISICQETLDVLEIVEPGISRLKGLMLYELHLATTILANRTYATREISARELLSQLEKAQGHLKRSLTMLLLEPATTPEGLLAKRALQEMKLLMQNVEDVKILSSQEELDKGQTTSRRQGKHRNKKQ